MKPSKRFSYYSYDSVQNPWCSGGGALRDMEAMKRFAVDWDVTLYVGKFPGFVPDDRDGVHIRGLGWGGSNLVCRITFGIMANVKVLFDRADRIGNSLSAYAPIVTGIFKPGRYFAVLHHIAAGASFRKFGALGLIPLTLENLMLRLGRNFIVSNATVAERIRRINSKARILITSNSIDSTLLDLPAREAASPFMLYLGRFDIQMKGLDLLIEAYHALNAAAESRVLPRLVLAGAASPEAQAAVRALIPKESAGSIDLKPNISEEEKRSLLSACLFFVSPSRFEGFGIAALEANAAGKPVLVTDTDGFRASVKKDVSALVIPIGDKSALQMGMKALIGDEALRLKLGKGGRDWARGFNWDDILAKESLWIGNGFVAAESSRPSASSVS